MIPSEVSQVEREPYHELLRAMNMIYLRRTKVAHHVWFGADATFEPRLHDGWRHLALEKHATMSRQFRQYKWS